ncbi:MAG: VWA domain-containing protein [Actinobacteria bacterium]|nr:VWA domain-containing protein [Actinomycetota bacterium]
MTVRYDYLKWDGTQDVSVPDTDELLSALTDDLLAGGDLSDAIRRIMRAGMVRRDGTRTPGLRDAIEKLRARKAELLASGDPDGNLEKISRSLDEIVREERDAIDEVAREDDASGDVRRLSVSKDACSAHLLELELMPDDVPGRIERLSGYDFVSSRAREMFDDLIDELRREVVETYFEGASKELENISAHDIVRMRDAYDALNKMLEQRERGEPEDPTFEEFIAAYGDMFPAASSLDELLERLAQRMAAAGAVWNSLSPLQQAELGILVENLLADMDLRWQVERLSSNLARAFPSVGWDRAHDFSGDGPLGLPEAVDLATQLAQIDRMEEILQSAASPAALFELDLEQVERELGEDVAKHLENLAKLTRDLQDAGLVEQRGARVELTPRGVRRIGQQALSDLYAEVNKDTAGYHRSVAGPAGHDREELVKPYEFGDPFNLHLTSTVHNAIRRRGTGLPVQLSPEDFDVVETESIARAATVLLVDLSMSMPMRENFVPAKKMAIALHSLISTRFPRDYLGIVGFSEVAREIRPDELPTAMWDYVYGTNLQHALALARRMLAHEHGTKQIICVTDGEPTAHVEPDGAVFFNYPPVPETLRLTMAEVLRCTRAKITINVFALDLEHTQYPFVAQIANVNGGRTFYTTKDHLGGYVLVDFLKHRQILRPAG